MKYLRFLIIFVLSSAFAQNSNIQIHQNTPDDLVEFVIIDKIPHPPIPREKIQKSLTKAKDGVSSLEKSPETIKSFFDNVTIVKKQLENKPLASLFSLKDMSYAPKASKDLSTLKLTFKPLIFDKGKLIAVVPTGTLINNSWTGVERYFRIDSVNIARLSEYDLGASKGKFYMLKDAINTDVNGKKAISKVFINDSNQVVEEVVWVNGKKMYTLTFGYTDDISAQKSKSIASETSALSLARELY